MQQTNTSSCHCGADTDFEACCKPFLDGEANAKTAEELMRSRYSAYVSEKIDYIVNTHDPDRREDVDRDSTEKWAKEASWAGLEIVDTQDGGVNDDQGVVEFIARYTMKGGEYLHHERSQFRKIDETWYYVDGEMVKPKPVVRDAPKVGRNDPCPCGSGKKFKKCCGL